MLAVMLRRRMADVGMDTGGVEPWAYHTVGGVQLATHSWMSHPRMSSDELIDYLTMLSWNALCGIVEVGGSLEKFRRNGTPVADPAATIAQTMSKSDDLPDPVDARATRLSGVSRRRQGRRHRHQRDPGLRGQEGRRRRRCSRSATSDSPNCRRCSTPTARARATTSSVLLVLQGMDTAGKGGIVKHVVGAANPQGIRYTRVRRADRGRAQAQLPVADPARAADGRPHRRVRPVALRGRAGRAGARPGAARGVGQALRRDQQVREEARRQRHDDHQGGDVRLARRAEEAAGQAAGRPDKYWKYNPSDVDERRCGRSTRRPTRRCWSGRRPTTRRGT